MGDADLASAVRYRISDIERFKNSEVVGIITSITDAVTPLLQVPGFQSYNITAEMLGRLTNKAAGYNDLLAGAGYTNKASSIANNNINDVIKLIRANIRQLSLLIGNFKVKNPEFCKAYYKASEVDKATSTTPASGASSKGSMVLPSTKPLSPAKAKRRSQKRTSWALTNYSK